MFLKKWLKFLGLVILGRSFKASQGQRVLANLFEQWQKLKCFEIASIPGNGVSDKKTLFLLM